ncbi:MAG: hypothetical protein WCD77_09830, partial [Acidobacteriaceae bacterium]
IKGHPTNANAATRTSFADTNFMKYLSRTLDKRLNQAQLDKQAGAQRNLNRLRLREQDLRKGCNRTQDALPGLNMREAIRTR